jgi:hypothetical protein
MLHMIAAPHPQRLILTLLNEGGGKLSDSTDSSRVFFFKGFVAVVTEVHSDSSLIDELREQPNTVTEPSRQAIQNVELPLR